MAKKTKKKNRSKLLAQNFKIPTIPITKHDIKYGTPAGKAYMKGDSPYYLKETGVKKA